MKFQRDRYSCGVLAIVNGARALGVRLSERGVRAHTGTTKDGTTQHGILNALERLGFSKSVEFSIADKDTAFLQVLTSVEAGEPVILSVEEDRHWVVVFGALGKRVLTFDSWNSQNNKAEAGVEVWSAHALRKWWTKQDGKYYGIVMRRA